MIKRKKNEYLKNRCVQYEYGQSIKKELNIFMIHQLNF